MTTLAELVVPKTKEEMRELLLLALKGVGFLSKTGYGTGSLAADGAAEDDLDVVVKISLAGELGVAEFDVSWDGGETYEVADSGQLTSASIDIGNGVTLTFANGASGDSFVLADEWAFSLNIPTLEATAWQPGSVPLSIVEMDSEAMADFSELQAKVAAGGFLTTGVDAWLDLWLEDMYGFEREPGTPTTGTIVLTDAASAGPFVIAIGDIWVGTADGLRFVNTAGGTLTQGGTLSLAVQADRVGTAHNVANDDIDTMFTPLPGVTVTNPIGASGWIIEAGTNRETDEEYRARASSRWPALGIGATADGYDLWARTASAGVTRTLVRNHPSTAGTVQIYLAGGAGAVSGAVVTAVDEYIQPRVPLSSIAVVASASTFAYTIAGTLYVPAGYGAAAVAIIGQNLAALNGGGENTDGELLDGIPIGGTIYASAIIEEVMRTPGARNFVMTPLVGADGAGNVALGTTDAAVLTCDVALTGSPDILVVEF